MTGTVSKFDIARGWGFIQPDEGGRDVFVHFSKILEPGFKALYPGDIVAFDIEDAEKGPRALEVRVLKPADLDSQ